jgi:4-hydroxybenzoate polyprenyltransferase
MADILAGYTIAGFSGGGSLPWLLLASVGLYGGGVVFNDLFDAAIDAVERPERPIPSGRLSRRRAAFIGTTLFGIGISAAWAASPRSGATALLIALLALLYDRWGKHFSILGPINMGACRGLNLLLGMGPFAFRVEGTPFLALIPFYYIAGITLLSRGEVFGGRTRDLYISSALITASFIGLLSLGGSPRFHFLSFLPFFLLLLTRVYPPLWRALRNRRPEPIRAAVRSGVLSLILLDAAFAGGYGGFLPGLAVSLLLPLTLQMAEWVT